MISVTWNGMGIPLLWMLLPTAGNSHTSERTELLDRLRAAFPDMKIAALMGDREFIGDAWMAYLQRQNIRFILRVRENQHVLREGYRRKVLNEVPALSPLTGPALRAGRFNSLLHMDARSADHLGPFGYFGLDICRELLWI
jgi:Transposase DDE domain